MISSIFLIISNNATPAVYKDSLLIKPATKKDFHLSSRTMEISKDGDNDEEDMFNRVANKGIARFGSIPYNHLFTKGGQVGLNNDRDGLRVDNKWRDSDIETNISFLLVANSYNRIMINDLCLKFDDPDIKITECPGIDDKYDEMKKFEWIIESYIRKEDLERCKELSKRAEDKKENAEKELGLDKKEDKECDIKDKTKECELEKKDKNIKQNKEDEENTDSTGKEKVHDTNKKEPIEKSDLPAKENKKMEDEEVPNEESVKENKIEEEKDLDNKNKTHAPNKKTHHGNEEPDKSYSENDQKPHKDTNVDNESFNANNEIIEEPQHSPQLSQQHPQQNNSTHPQSSQLNHQPSQQNPSSPDSFPQEPVSHPQTRPTNKMHSQLNPQLKPNNSNDDFPLPNNLNNQKDPENLENIKPNDKEITNERYPRNDKRNQNNGKTYGGMQNPRGEYDTPQNDTPNDYENKRYPPNNNTNNSSIDRNDSAKIVNLLQKLVENNQNTNMLNEDSDTEKNDNLDAIYRFLHESVNDFNQYKKRNNYDQ